MNASSSVRAALSAPGTTGAAVRAAARSGALTGHTSGLAPGIAQANVVIVPAEYAFEFLAFCVRNPRPCPLLEVLDAGASEARETAPGSDMRSDVPRYRVWRYGLPAEEVTDIRHLWPAPAAPPATSAAAAGADSVTSNDADARTDWVTFLLGCSFSFEEALLDAGVPVRHLQEERVADGAVVAVSGEGSNSNGVAVTAVPSPSAVAASTPLARDPRNVPMYRTHCACAPAGRFAGPLVVSMRPMTPAQAAIAATVTAAFPRVHGAPVYAGDQAYAALGITDLNSPDYGDRVTVRDGEVPVFWACGVTPQAALIAAKLPIAITHAPGHMFVTDLLNKAIAGPAGKTVPGIASSLPGDVLPLT